MGVTNFDVVAALGVDKEMKHAASGVDQWRILSCRPVVVAVDLRDDQTTFVLL